MSASVFSALPAALRQALARRSSPLGTHQPRTRQSRLRWRLIQVTSVVALMIGVGIAFEAQSSMLQAKLLSRVAENMSYSVRPGPAATTHFPVAGPYDERLGYTAIPKFVERLGQEGFKVSHQAQPNAELSDFIARGGYAVYREKTQAGLSVLDRDGHTMFSRRYPDSAYRDFDAVPPAVSGTLTFIEDRGLLDARYPAKNPAVDWMRFSAAAATPVLKVRAPSAAAPARWPPSSKNSATRPRGAPDRRKRNSARWPPPVCAPTWAARIPWGPASASSPTTLIPRRWARAPDSARSTASLTASRSGTAPTSPPPTRCLHASTAP